MSLKGINYRSLGYWYNQLEQNRIDYQVIQKDFCIYGYAGKKSQ